MGKLLKLAQGAEATIGANAVANVMRDIMINDATPRNAAFLGSSTKTFDREGENLGAAPALKDSSYIGMYDLGSGAVLAEENTAVKHLTVEKVGQGYKVSHASVGDGTPAAMAALAFGDDARTTFKSLQEFVKLTHQNTALSKALAEDVIGAGAGEHVSGVIIDQLNSKLVIFHGVNLSSLDTQNHAISAGSGRVLVQFDDSTSTQFGE